MPALDTQDLLRNEVEINRLTRRINKLNAIPLIGPWLSRHDVKLRKALQKQSQSIAPTQPKTPASAGANKAMLTGPGSVFLARHHEIVTNPPDSWGRPLVSANRTPTEATPTVVHEELNSPPTAPRPPRSARRAILAGLTAPNVRPAGFMDDDDHFRPIFNPTPIDVLGADGPYARRRRTIETIPVLPNTPSGNLDRIYLLMPSVEFERFEKFGAKKGTRGGIYMMRNDGAIFHPIVQDFCPLIARSEFIPLRTPATPQATLKTGLSDLFEAASWRSYVERRRVMMSNLCEICSEPATGVVPNWIYHTPVAGAVSIRRLFSTVVTCHHCQAMFDFSRCDGDRQANAISRLAMLNMWSMEETTDALGIIAHAQQVRDQFDWVTDLTALAGENLVVSSRFTVEATGGLTRSQDVDKPAHTLLAGVRFKHESGADVPFMDAEELYARIPVQSR